MLPSVLVPNTPDKLVRLWGQKQRELAKKSKVDKDTLELLVCCAYHLGEITEGRASEILDLFRLDFRSLYVEWSKNYTQHSDD